MILPGSMWTKLAQFKHLPYICDISQTCISPSLSSTKANPLIPGALLRLSSPREMEVCFLSSFAERSERHTFLLRPICILIFFEKCQVDRCRSWVELPIRRKGNPILCIHVAVCDIPNDLISTSLVKRDMNDRGLATKFGFFDNE